MLDNHISKLHLVYCSIVTLNSTLRPHTKLRPPIKLGSGPPSGRRALSSLLVARAGSALQIKSDHSQVFNFIHNIAKETINIAINSYKCTSFPEIKTNHSFFLFKYQSSSL